jgi:hypothetical protein
MVGFKVLSDVKDGECLKLPISSQTLSAGDLIDLSVGATTWAACTAASLHYTRKAICMEAATSAATEVLAYIVTGSELVEAQTANTVSAANNGDRMVLIDKNTVSDTDTDATVKEVCFLQMKPGSTTTSAIGYILVGSGVAPSAT